MHRTAALAASVVLLLTGCAPAAAAARSAEPLRCPAPATDAGASSRSTTPLVPFEPVQALLCFSGQERRADGGVHVGRLGTLRVRRAVDVEALRTALNASSRLWPPGLYNCPADWDSRVDIALRGTTPAVEVVSVWLTGCAHASNGRLRRTIVTEQLARLLVADARRAGVPSHFPR